MIHWYTLIANFSDSLITLSTIFNWHPSNQLHQTLQSCTKLVENTGYRLHVADCRLLNRVFDWANICLPKVIKVALLTYSKSVKVIYMTTVICPKLVKWLRHHFLKISKSDPPFSHACSKMLNSFSTGKILKNSFWDSNSFKHQYLENKKSKFYNLCIIRKLIKCSFRNLLKRQCFSRIFWYFAARK